MKDMIFVVIVGVLRWLGFGNAKVLDGTERFVYYHAECRRLFRKYLPAAIVLASGGADGHDSPFIIYASKFGAAAVATDNNIDVFEFRYFARPRPLAKWMLFSEAQKQIAASVQKIKEENIAVTGAARYDYYFRDFKPLPRDEFLRSLGIDPAKKLITFGAKIPKLYPYNAEVLETLLATIRERLGGNAELFVRFDPGHDERIYGSLLNEFKWEKAEQAAHRDHVANLLYHSDVVISVNSTFSIESCLINVPSIWIGFGGGEESERGYLVTYRLEMFKRIAKTGGIPAVRSPGELSDLVVRYASDRAADQAKRLALVEQEYYGSDGRSGERVAAVIQQLLDERFHR
ncbi:MAG: CDP-glycerol glycerophosphotransferase family protein [Parcubacteria group bacterium]|nr:CDP-glycerol glycerophosphotransferase family protein [Parcubacteria group bacterium]